MNTSRYIAIVFSAVLVTSPAAIAQASSEERAQLFKGEVRRQFMTDGWTPVHESRHQLVLEKPMTGVSGAIVHALTAEPNGSRPIWRWTFMFKPISERETSHHAQASVSTRDVSGKAKPIPLSTNAANQKYIDAKLRAANAAMPAKYKSAKR
jgi:hypothetical protein